MHIGGEGAVGKLAEGVRAIFDKVKEIRTANPQPAKSFGLGQLPEKNSIEGEAISQVFAQKGDAKDGMYKVTIGRETKMACGCAVGNTMGINTWAAFAGTSDDALVVGDFVMLENELQTVLKTLRGADRAVGSRFDRRVDRCQGNGGCQSSATEREVDTSTRCFQSQG
jgi:hypothetical protein